MHISWNFLDKRKATIKAIESFDSMKFIINHTEEDVQAVRSRMEGAGSSGLDGMPKSHNDSAGEDRIIKGIEEIDMLKERYRRAVEYMNWFKPAWGQLTEEEQYLLETFYMDEDEMSAASAIQQELNISQSSAYNKKNRALNHLTLLLYGKV